MRAAQAIIGIALAVIGTVVIANPSADGTVWWLVAGLAAAAGLAGLLSAAKPAETSY